MAATKVKENHIGLSAQIAQRLNAPFKWRKRSMS